MTKTIVYGVMITLLFSCGSSGNFNKQKFTKLKPIKNKQEQTIVSEAEKTSDDSYVAQEENTVGATPNDYFKPESSDGFNTESGETTTLPQPNYSEPTPAEFADKNFSEELKQTKDPQVTKEEEEQVKSGLNQHEKNTLADFIALLIGLFLVSILFIHLFGPWTIPTGWLVAFVLVGILTCISAIGNLEQGWIKKSELRPFYRFLFNFVHWFWKVFFVVLIVACALFVVFLLVVVIVFAIAAMAEIISTFGLVLGIVIIVFLLAILALWISTDEGHQALGLAMVMLGLALLFLGLAEATVYVPFFNVLAIVAFSIAVLAIILYFIISINALVG